MAANSSKQYSMRSRFAFDPAKFTKEASQFSPNHLDAVIDIILSVPSAERTHAEWALLDDLVRPIPFFAQFANAPKERHHILSQAKLRVLSPGEVLFRQGDVGDAFYIARHDSAEDFSRMYARRCTATDRIFIPAYCFAIP